MNLVRSSGVWLGVAACAVLALVWIWRVASAARRIARRPAASVGALNLHDASVGWAARACGLISYIALALVGAHWGPSWSRGGGWLIGAAGTITVVALIVMELRWPVPGGTVRVAVLGRRRIRDIVPRAGAAIACLGLVTGVGAILICGISARSIGPGTNPPTPDFAWPSWSQTLPLSIGLVAVVAITAVAAWVLVRRPALAGLNSAIDIAYRRAAMDRVLRVGGVAGFLAAAMVTNSLKNFAMGSMQPWNSGWPVVSVLGWQSIVLFVVALASIELFRAKLPHAPAEAVAPAVSPR